MNSKVVNFSQTEADITRPSISLLSFSTAARFLPDGRYVPTWLWDRIAKVDDEQLLQGPPPLQEGTHSYHHYPQYHPDIIKMNQHARDNLRGKSGRARRPPSAPSHRDTRFPHAQPEAADSPGPGMYALPPTLISKAGASFQASSRRELWDDRNTVEFGGASHLLSKIEPADIKKHLEKSGQRIGLDNCLQRSSVEDYRYSTRHSEKGKDLPSEATKGTLRLDCAGRLTRLYDKAVSNRLGALPFESRSKKFDSNPSSAASSPALGPGSHLPYTSIGGNGRRKSYRIQPSIGGGPMIGPSSASFI